ncbi:hypothetical protein Ancab_013627 [Ancistrocladus abbreviatus]
MGKCAVLVFLYSNIVCVAGLYRPLEFRDWPPLTDFSMIVATPFMTSAQQRPEYVHQLYSEASTMLRIDGHNRKAATAMLPLFIRCLFFSDMLSKWNLNGDQGAMAMFLQDC